MEKKHLRTSRPSRAVVRDHFSGEGVNLKNLAKAKERGIRQHARRNELREQNDDTKVA